jgi:membrane fusion protein, multidrug efflux system
MSSPAATSAKKASPIRRIILLSLLVVAVGTAAKYGWAWFQDGRFMLSTDDAYVQADTSVLGAKISGYVAEVPVADNSAVKAGDVILRLDGADYQFAIDAAKAKIASQNAAIAVVSQQHISQGSQVAAAIAQMASAKSIELHAVLTQQRASQMIKTNIGSQQALDDANQARDTAAANIAVAQANIDSAKAQLGVLSANEAQAKSVLAELNVALQKAEHDMNFVEIKAPFDGVIANRAVEPGQFVTAGTRLMALVPTTQSYVQANFKETQLSDIRAGQKAFITVDAFQGERFEGKVLSVSPASGAEFSLLPPENATGNFTKITQRFPVKISLPRELAAKIRPGLSVVVEVDSRDKGAN